MAPKLPCPGFQDFGGTEALGDNGQGRPVGKGRAVCVGPAEEGRSVTVWSRFSE